MYYTTLTNICRNCGYYKKYNKCYHPNSETIHIDDLKQCPEGKW